MLCPRGKILRKKNTQNNYVVVPIERDGKRENKDSAFGVWAECMGQSSPALWMVDGADRGPM